MRNWADDTKFHAVILRRVHDKVETIMKFPARDTVAEAKVDLACFFKRCYCSRRPLKLVDLERGYQVQPEGTACLSEIPRPVWIGESGYSDYIDNDRGFRALPWKV